MYINNLVDGQQSGGLLLFLLFSVIVHGSVWGIVCVFRCRPWWICYRFSQLFTTHARAHFPSSDTDRESEVKDMFEFNTPDESSSA